MRIKYLIVIVLLLIPSIVLAEPSASLNVDKNTIENGASVTATVTLTDTAAWNIVLNGSGAATCITKQADVTADAKSTTKQFSLTCNSTSEGKITFNLTGDITSGAGKTNDISISKQVTVTKAKSSINTLSELKVDDVMVPNFTSSNTSYILKDSTEEKINITATATDSKATLVGTGTKELKYGKNTFDIVVTAENGTKKTYTITVNKLDARSSNNNLKTLSVSNAKIEFNKNTTSYTVKYEHDIKDINITATAEDNKAKISGAGKKTLNDYNNEFKIVVTAENETTKTYIIKAIRKDSLGNYGKLSTDNSVKSISVTNYDIKFNKDVKSYNLLVEENVNDIEVKVIPNDEKANIEISGNNNLEPGLNEVKIRVISESGLANEYTLKVYKIGEKSASNTTTTDNIDVVNVGSNNSSNNGNSNNIWIITSIIESLLLIGVVIFIIIYNNKMTLKNKQNNLGAYRTDGESGKEV